MKNKRLVYLLLPVAVLVWGLIGYKIWSPLAGDEELTPTAVAARRRPTKLLGEEAVPALSLAYADPFSGQRVQAAAQPSVATSTTTPSTLSYSRSPASIPSLPAQAPVATAVVMEWPTVAYRGLIENRQKHTRVAMLTINGMDYLMKETETQVGITANRVYPDSVVIIFQKYRKVIPRQQ